MSIVKINAIAVPEERRDQFEQRFRSRAGAVENSPGFEWFELLRPLAGTDRYLVYTRWADEASFEAWKNSQDFSAAHSGPAHGTGPGSGQGTGPAQPPAGHGADLWSLEVLESVGPKG